MRFFPRLPFRKKKVGLDKHTRKDIGEIVHSELAPYITREQFEEYMNKIRSDERRLQMWNRLSTRGKIKLLRYVATKRGAQHGKK